MNTTEVFEGELLQGLLGRLGLESARSEVRQISQLGSAAGRSDVLRSTEKGWGGYRGRTPVPDPPRMER